MSILPAGAADVGGGYVINASACPDRLFAMAFDPVSSAITFVGVVAHSNPGASYYSGCVTPQTIFGNMYRIDPVSGLGIDGSIASFDGTSTIGSDVNTSTFSAQAMNGAVYMFLNGVLKAFNTSLNSWSTILGTGTTGHCADNTLAGACAVSVNSAFVDPHGNVYFLDAGVLRAIVNGRVFTLYGQAPDFGDGGLAIDARFGNILNVQEKNDGTIVLLDSTASKFRQFSRGSTIQTLAGNGSIGDPTYGQSPASEPLRAASYWGFFIGFYVDQATNDIVYNIQRNFMKLSASSGYWSAYSGSSIPFTDPSANGALIGQVQVATGDPPARITATSEGKFLYQTFDSTAYAREEVDYASGVNTFDLTPNSTYSADYCADGTSVAACANGPMWNLGSYDPDTNHWLEIVSDGRTIRSYGSSGTMSTLTTLSQPATSWTFKRFNGSRYVYYCSTMSKTVRLRNVDTSTEMSLPWPISSIGCSGSSLIYDSTNHSLVFPMVQNGLNGVGELLNVEPSLNGL